MTSTQVKVFKFKKIDWYGKGRKINQPEVTMTLKYDEENRPCLSICGNVWNSTHTDIVCGGQNLDEMIKYKSISSDPTFNKLYYLWINHHLNDCCCGSPAQLAAIKAYHIANKENSKVNLNSFDADIDYLKSVGLYDDNGNVYGSKWFYMEIPNDDLQMINELLTQE